MTLEEMLDRKLAMFRLINQAERTEHSLRRAWLAEESSLRRERLEHIYRRSIDRTSRREDAYRRFRDGLPPVTTAQVAGWVHGRVAACGIAVPDPAQLAGEACEAFGTVSKPRLVPQQSTWPSARTAQVLLPRVPSPSSLAFWPKQMSAPDPLARSTIPSTLTSTGRAREISVPSPR